MLIRKFKDNTQPTEGVIVVMDRDEALQLANNLLEQIVRFPNTSRKEFFEAGEYFSVLVATDEQMAELRKPKRKGKKER